MTPEQYWQGDPALVRAFRKANELRKDRLNQEAWWQGLYFYEALCASSPLFRAFGKKGTKAAPYPKEPYDIKPKKQKQKKKVVSAEEKQMLRMKSIMQAFMVNNNSQKNKQKGGTSPNGGQRSND